MTAPAAVEKLVERFDAHRDDYRSGKYNETQLRRDFLDPLFEALGWDVHNQQGYAEAYREVIHEDAIKIGGRTKAPDYCFRVGGGVRSFFVEAKKPSVDIRDAISPAYQLRRYGWSAKLPVSILTDFEEFAVYDCRIRPVKTDKASTARVIYYQYTDYLDHWDELFGLFSPEAIRQGALDRFVASKRVKKGTAEVDTTFLDEIESWRMTLARNIALRNQRIDQRELNFAVQRTIDRIIFLRVCEDRGIEPYGRLQDLLGGRAVYRRLAELFERADERYNSGLFHFNPEKSRTDPPDELTLGLAIDDKPLKDILRRLYFPDSPYEFSVLPAEILGQVYEQFLGKVIRLTAGHQAKVEEKPEVRKAGGVYYTPAYIVDYIVRQTVGKLLEGKTPRTASKLRVLDPACGSGSFLIGVYQHLLDWHRDWYIANDPSRHARARVPKLYRGPSGDWLLTTAEKKRILLNNIHGVDIDAQAVEVTKLSLLLKVLEGESQETLSNQLRLFRERALPDLSGNIKCGNSLIGPDFYDDKQMSLLDEEEVYRINVFDWKAEFPGVFKGKGGGFDAVIGNPPYIRIQTLRETQPESLDYFKGRYRASSSGNYDIYAVFVEAGLQLLSPEGQLGFIVPHKFFGAKYGEPLRELIAQGQHVSHIVHFGDQQVFVGPTTYTCLLFLDRSGVEQCRFCQVDNLLHWRNTQDGELGVVSSVDITAREWKFRVGKNAPVLDKVDAAGMKLGDIAHLFVGLQTDADDVYILEVRHDDADRTLCFSKFTQSEHWLERAHLKPFLKGSLNIRRYHLANTTKRLIFPYETRGTKSLLIDADDYQERFPLTWSYLEACRPRLAARDKGRMGGQWYGYVYRKNHIRFEKRKIVVPSIATGSCFAADPSGRYYFVGSGGGGGGGYGIVLLDGVTFSDKYLLGVLNSRLLSTYLKATSTQYRGGYIALNKQYIEGLPVYPIDLSCVEQRVQHDRIVESVDRLGSLHERASVARTSHQKTVLLRQIAATDSQIDRLVYELYDLTDDEINIVEEAGG